MRCQYDNWDKPDLIAKIKELEKHPTLKQMEAYIYVYIHGAKQEQVAAILGIGRTAVAERLRRLRKKFPWMFENPIKSVRFETFLSFDEARNYSIIQRF